MAFLQIQFNRGELYRFVCFALGAGLLIQLVFKLYRGIIRHASIQEASRLLAALFCKELILLIAILLYSGFSSQWLAIVLLDLLISFFLVISVRALLVSIYFTLVGGNLNGNRLLFIYGTDNHSIALINWVRSGALHPYVAVGLLSTDMSQSGLRIGGLPVFAISTPDSFRKLLTHVRLQTVMFPDYATVQHERNRFVEVCLQSNIELLVAPPVELLDNPEKAREHMREIKIEDLLGREQISINMDEISSVLKEEVILVTGAAGSIGSEICRLLASIRVKQLILFDNAETPMHDLRLEIQDRYPMQSFVPIIGDVRIKSRLEFVFTKYAPTVVFHAAAYKHVPLMESNPCEAIRVNVRGTRNMADHAVKYGVERFVMVSTDKAVNPTNVMGCSKRLAEIYVQSLATAIKNGTHPGVTKFITTRFGNVLGSNGSVIPRFREQIEKGGPITVTHPDIIRYFMTIPEACRLVLEAGTMGKGGEIFIFEMGEPVKIADLARRMIELAGFEPDVDIQISYTGLRPGEKLYEELLSNEENTLPTPHEKIRVAKVREYNYQEIEPRIDSLTQVARQGLVLDTVLQMKQIVPEFISQNSEFEKLDIKQPVSR